MPRKSYLLLFLLLSVGFVHAQLCQGSLGEPIVNITFGAGQNPGNPLNAAATGYQYIGTGCPQDGFYTVRNSTVGCNVGWHVLSADHTGDPNGYFMLVNASNQPSAFYVDTVDLSCNNTTYEFAAWIANMNQPSECSGAPRQPNLTFQIESITGTLLQSYNSGNIPPQTSIAWRQYGFFFNTPASISRVVVRIINNAVGGCGNDLALDDITFRPCGAPITVGIDGNSGNTKNICIGDAAMVVLSGSVPADFTNPVYQWQRSTNGGATWTDIAGAAAATYQQSFATAAIGEYLYRVTVNKQENSGAITCRVRSGVLTVKVNAKPAAINIRLFGSLCEGSRLKLAYNGDVQNNITGPNGINNTATTSGPIQNDTITFPELTPALSGRYYLTITNAAGCSVRDSVDIIVKPKPAAFVVPDDQGICEGDTVQLTATGGGSYTWLPGRGLSATTIPNPLAYPTDTTVYQLVVTNADGCTDTATATINVYRKPTANAGSDKAIIKGQQVQLQGAAGGTNVLYEWSPPEAINDITLLQPTVFPTEDKTYTLTVTSAEGCGTALDSVLVKTFAGIFVPTAFTPNADGRNDRWIIPGLTTYKSYEVMVFNRWGEMVYRSKNAGDGWDGTYKGKLLTNGVYPYLIKLDAAPFQLKGWVMIIR